MQINPEMLARMTNTITNPTLLGHAMQICMGDRRDEERSVSIISLFFNPEVAKLDFRQVAQIFKFFVSLSEGTALSVAREMEHLGASTALALCTVPEFQMGFVLGFLEGLAASKDDYLQSTQNVLGVDFASISRFAPKEKIKSAAFVGDLSNAVATVSERCYYFVDGFMTSVRKCPNVLLSDCFQRIHNGFLHAEIPHQTPHERINLWAALCMGRASRRGVSSKVLKG